MRKVILYFSLLILCLGNINAKAQDSIRTHNRQPVKPNPWERVFVGGYLGAYFSGPATSVYVAPIIGYWITDKLAGGIGITYQYYHYKDNFYEVESNVYGGSIFGRYFFTPYLFGHLEFEYLNLEAYDFVPTRRVDVTGLLAGGGYMQPIGRHAGITAMILYNFSESRYTPYGNPIIRIGVMAGF